MRAQFSTVILGGLLAMSGGAVLAAAPETQVSAASTTSAMGEAQAGVWTPKEAKFVYQGFTTRYSCDSLNELLQHVLRQLGAQPSDLKVRRTGCTESSSKPSPFPGVDITMSVLQVAPSSVPASTTIPAHWKTVNVKLDGGNSNDGGHCELIEQLRRQIVPLFTTRNVDSQTSCVPHQLPVGRPTLKLQVLLPDAQPPKKS
jgi:hypothetical protein